MTDISMQDGIETAKSGGGEPRGVVSVLLVGLLLGPVALMLWLGRGRLAFVYLGAILLVMAAFFAGAVSGIIPPVGWLSADWLFTAVEAPVFIAGLMHGFAIRKTSLARPWYSRWFIALPAYAVATTAVVLPIRTFLFQPFNAPSGSMIPSLQPGDYFIVSKMRYGYSRFSMPFGLTDFPGRLRGALPERGDIVVFRHPLHPDTDYIKRLIGFPGDHIQMIDGVLHINGTAVGLVPETSAGAQCFEEPCHFFRETLPNGVNYVINDATMGSQADNTDEYVVPEDEFFVMGDNRDNSLDSRYQDTGTVPFDHLIGKAQIIFWNSFGLHIDGRLQGYPH